MFRGSLRPADSHNTELRTVCCTVTTFLTLHSPASPDILRLVSAFTTPHRGLCQGQMVLLYKASNWKLQSCDSMACHGKWPWIQTVWQISFHRNNWLILDSCGAPALDCTRQDTISIINHHQGLYSYFYIKQSLSFLK